MTAGISRQDLKRDELITATVSTGKWIERHGWLAGAGAIVFVVVVLGFLGWRWNEDRAQTRASESLAEGEKLFRTAERAGFLPADLERALESFRRGTEAGGSSPSGRLAAYWQGVTLYRLGRGEEAATVLESVFASPAAAPTLAGSAKVLAADAWASAGQSDRAIALLEELAAADPETFPADQALLTLAKLREQAGDTAGARRALQNVVDRFPGRGAGAEAREGLGR